VAEDDQIAPEHRENARNALAFLNSQFIEGGPGAMSTDALQQIIADHPTRPVQLLVLLRYQETGVHPTQTLEELGRVLAPPSE
jgi:hypothetical protein